MLQTSKMLIFYIGAVVIILMNYVFLDAATLSIALRPTVAIITLASIVFWLNSRTNTEYSHPLDEKQSPQINYASSQIVDRMANRMNKSLKKHLNIPCTILAIEDTDVAYEIDIIIGDEDLLTAYQEVAIVPYERIRDMDYWQQITKILISNYRVRSNPQPSVNAKQEMVKASVRRRRPSSSKTNTKAISRNKENDQ